MRKQRSRRVSLTAPSLKDAVKVSRVFSRHRRTFALPDLRAEIEQLLVVNDRAIVRYTFVGHFTGTFKDVKGDGRAISFRAVDIYRVQNGKISDNWHLEDNLSFMQQLGVVKP